MSYWIRKHTKLRSVQLKPASMPDTGLMNPSAGVTRKHFPSYGPYHEDDGGIKLFAPGTRVFTSLVPRTDLIDQLRKSYNIQPIHAMVDKLGGYTSAVILGYGV